MPSTGLTLTGTGANNADAGDKAWTSPTNSQADDAANAQALFDTGGVSQTSQYLHCTNFGFAIPAGATVVGVVVRWQKVWTGAGAARIQDHTIQLIKAGTRSGNNKADTVTNWTATPTNFDLGSSSDSWGVSLTGSDVNLSTFGVALRATRDGASGSSPAAEVDAVWINVHYTVPGGSQCYIIGA